MLKTAKHMAAGPMVPDQILRLSLSGKPVSDSKDLTDDMKRLADDCEGKQLFDADVVE